ncbi:MAG TPA: hypothetical protein VJZ76_05515 [Thermoanaerobaculia bacterium]|nr:hypothetical protein [Thermoanaerobaculia bacterium]
MKTAGIDELRAHIDDYIDALKHGKAVEIIDGGKTIGHLRPTYEYVKEIADGFRERGEGLSIEQWLDYLVEAGAARRGSGSLPDDFLTRPLPKFEHSVLEQLLEDRHSDD